MGTRSFKLQISPSLGKVSAKCTAPGKPLCVLTLAHGAGAGMDHSFMESLAERLSDAGIAVLRFNFPFAENKKGRPDTPAVAHQTIAAAVQKAADLFPKLPLFMTGKSFGGRMSSQYLAADSPENVKGIIFYGFPLHPSGRPSVERAEHLKEVKIPMLFLQGTKDTLATWELIEGVCKSLSKATLHKLEGADHSFKAGKKDILADLVVATETWITRYI